MRGDSERPSVTATSSSARVESGLDLRALHGASAESRIWASAICALQQPPAAERGGMQLLP